MDVFPNIPEHIWSAIRDLMDRDPKWSEIRLQFAPSSRMEEFHCYCQWYFQFYGVDPFDSVSE